MSVDVGNVSSLSVEPTPPPLRFEGGGGIRVGQSRVGLEVVVEQFENGMTPEDIVRAYDTLVLSDVYAVIAYYLRNREVVQQYLERQREAGDVLRAKIEAERPRITREGLSARRGT